MKGREGTRAPPGLQRAAARLAAETSFERAAALCRREAHDEARRCIGYVENNRARIRPAGSARHVRSRMSSSREPPTAGP